MAAAQEVAQAIARQAGEFLQENRFATKQISVKTDMVDLVTNVDKAADRLITEQLRIHFPTHTIIAEESAQSGPQSPYCWYIDPLDGTTNFAHTYPHFAVSLALTHESTAIVGVVHDPVRNETFSARRGGGAQLNGNPIRVSTASQLDQSLLLTGFPYDRRSYSAFYLRYYEAFMLRTHGVRRSGSAALDLCYVACGRADAFWEWRLHPWDIAAGSLIVEEAGGRTSDFSGHTFDLHGEQTLASNGHLHGAMLDVLGQLPGSPS
ncbi:MAG: inositol monophosphatase family protein [Desulfurellaceae bacterium]|nr:inositol monophosphatase family protein [Desulfurellaceae bacterium]